MAKPNSKTVRQPELKPVSMSFLVCCFICCTVLVSLALNTFDADGVLHFLLVVAAQTATAGAIYAFSVLILLTLFTDVNRKRLLLVLISVGACFTGSLIKGWMFRVTYLDQPSYPDPVIDSLVNAGLVTVAMWLVVREFGEIYLKQTITTSGSNPTHQAAKPLFPDAAKITHMSMGKDGSHIYCGEKLYMVNLSFSDVVLSLSDNLGIQISAKKWIAFQCIVSARKKGQFSFCNNQRR